MSSTTRKVRPRPIPTSSMMPFVFTPDYEEEIDNKTPVRKKEKIPVPPIRSVEDYEATMASIRFQVPKYYVKDYQCTYYGSIPRDLRYDLLKDDLEYVVTFNTYPEAKRGGHILTNEELMSLLDHFEKEASRLDVSVDPQPAYPCTLAARSVEKVFGWKGKFVELAYNWWRKKRKKLRKALIREFQQPPAPDNPSPHVAFRPRGPARRASSRNPRRNDLESYGKMRNLQNDFQQVKQLLKKISARERLKKERLLLGVQHFDQQLAVSSIGKPFHEMSSRLAAEKKIAPMQEQLLTQFDKWRESQRELSRQPAATRPKVTELNLPKETLAALMKSCLPTPTYVKSSHSSKRRRRASDKYTKRKKRRRVALPPMEDEYLSDNSDDERFYDHIAQYLSNTEKQRPVPVTPEDDGPQPMSSMPALVTPIPKSIPEAVFLKPSLPCPLSPSSLPAWKQSPDLNQPTPMPLSFPQEPGKAALGIARARLGRNNRILIDLFPAKPPATPLILPPAPAPIPPFHMNGPLSSPLNPVLNHSHPLASSSSSSSTLAASSLTPMDKSSALAGPASIAQQPHLRGPGVPSFHPSLLDLALDFDREKVKSILSPQLPTTI